MKVRGLLLASLLLLAQSPINAMAVTAKHPVRDYKGMAMAADVFSFAGWSAGLGVGLDNYSTNTTQQTVTQTGENPFLSGVPGDSGFSVIRALPIVCRQPCRQITRRCRSMAPDSDREDADRRHGGA